MAAVFLFAISRNANKCRKVPQLTGKFQTRFMTMVKAIIGPLTKPGSDCSDRIGSDSGSDRIGFRIGLVSSLLVQKNYFDKSCFNNDTGGSDIFI